MSRKYWIIGLWLVSFFSLSAQVKLPVYPDSMFNTYYHQRATLFERLPSEDQDILFVGNSITDGGEWSELFGNPRVKNRGISGDFSPGIIHRLPSMAKRKPAKIFLMIGVNDLSRGYSVDSILRNIFLIVDFLHQETPRTELFVQSVLPVNNFFGKFSGHTSKGDSIRNLNQQLSANAAPHRYVFLDLYPSFCGPDGKLSKEYTNDGLHLTGDGYLLWTHLVYPAVFGFGNRPGLIPQPRQLTWSTRSFWLNKARSLSINDSVLMPEAVLLQQWLQEKGCNVPVRQMTESVGGKVVMTLQKDSLIGGSPEGYRLTVNDSVIHLVGSTQRGIFYGLQTLRQLMRDGVIVDGCVIEDWPAFSWRGYMIDVGRNFMPVQLLKQQIDVLSQYKYNVFHLHLTEDIAWRLQIRSYPALTDPASMLRDKGEFYTEAELKDLIRFAKQRHITLIPEIDMPGHSAAFTRALGYGMQTDSGKIALRNILREICSAYDLPYIHIGSDEVRITDTSFVPEMTALLEQEGRQVIGWQPGANFKASTIRQLWREDQSVSALPSTIRFVDSKHLYLNHMDPLEAVATIFNRQIAKREKGDSVALGATLCVWHDRAVREAEDVLRMNPVYPGIVTFGERCWSGGGKSGWIANVSDGDVPGFTAYEHRLIEHRDLYFKDRPFPYVPSANQVWDLFGPFDNKGDVRQAFPEEPVLKSGGKLSPAKQVIGGTVVLRHWWFPWITGAVTQPKENSTWYARTRIWSETDRVANFWIGSENLSRSTASDSPPAGAWDHKGSAIWLNGNAVSAPDWNRPDQKGQSEIPLVDEGYEYRLPTPLALKKGWNTVLFKLPVASFKARSPQHPNKWMFTFVEVK